MASDPRVEPLAQALWLAEEQRTHRLARRIPWESLDSWNRRRYEEQAAAILAWQPAGPVEGHGCPALAGRPLYGYLPRVAYEVGVRKPRTEYWLGPLAPSLAAAKESMRAGDPRRGEHEAWSARDVIALAADGGGDVAVWAEYPGRPPIHLCEERA